MDASLYLVFLHTIGFSQKALSRIFEGKNNYQEFYENIRHPILETLWYKEEKIAKILEAKAMLDTNKIIDIIKKLQVRIITIQDTEYPELLKEIPVSPYFLYVRGSLPSDTKLLSVVGSRKNTPYSRTSLSMILPEMIRKWYGIVSGWAYGVDALAHKISIEQNGYTLAVFGTGIDRCYPKENKALFQTILDRGWALVSTFPIGMWPESYNFPIRNEVVAGISRGTLVTEAAEKSGTLITAGLALDFGREVFALPGDITKTTSTGTNRMIRDGEAKLVIEATDILCEYETVSIRENKIDPVIIHTCNDPVEKSLYELLMKGAYNISDMEDILGLDIAIISFKLSMMEVRGIIHMGMDGSYNIK